MGFPSPAADFAETRISLDQRLIHKPAATYFMLAGETIYRCGIMKDALLVVDASLSPCDGSLLVCECEGMFKVKDTAHIRSRTLRTCRTVVRRSYQGTMTMPQGQGRSSG